MKRKQKTSLAARRLDHGVDWIKSLENCMSTGLLTSEEYDQIIATDELSVELLDVIKNRLWQKSINKFGFMFAWESLKKQLTMN
jgi:hypothetical protein